MPSSCDSESSDNIAALVSSLQAIGYIKATRISKTLQGSIWRCVDKESGKSVVIKATDRHLHSQSVSIQQGKTCRVLEDIITETEILKQLTEEKECPPSIVKFVDFCNSDAKHYYLVMQDGGTSLFDFVCKAHKLLANGHFTIPVWHALIKVIFKQMLEALEYVHAKNISHHDISLENWLIAQVDIVCSDNGEPLQFVHESVFTRLCDFGLSEKFSEQSNSQSTKYCGKPCYYSPEVTAKKAFDAKSNDVWCLGVCLFMMLIGGNPWQQSNCQDAAFVAIMSGNLRSVVTHWNRGAYVNQHILALFDSIFQFEDNRSTLQQIKECQWLQEKV